MLLQEVALTILAAQYELRKVKSASITLGSGIGAVTLGGILLMLMLVHLLEAWTVVPLWGCYGIVGGLFTVVGAVVPVAWPPRCHPQSEVTMSAIQPDAPIVRCHAFCFGPRPCSARASAVTAVAVFSTLKPEPRRLVHTLVNSAPKRRIWAE